MHNQRHVGDGPGSGPGTVLAHGVALVFAVHAGCGMGRRGHRMAWVRPWDRPLAKLLALLNAPVTFAS